MVVDVFNHYEFEGGEQLAESAAATLASLQYLVAEAVQRRVPVLYVNDRHDDWTAGPEAIIARARAGGHPELIDACAPPTGAPFLPKTRHSAFFGTSLDLLLGEHDATRVILCGQVTEQCVLYSALDAYVRGLDLTVARDAVAHIDRDLAEAALTMMERNMGAAVVPAADALSAGA